MKIFKQYRKVLLPSYPSSIASSVPCKVCECVTYLLQYNLLLWSTSISPEEYKKTFKGEQFFLYHFGADTQRIIIFCTQRELEMLNLSRISLADGTFKSVPSLFTQVYVIHALRGSFDLLNEGHPLQYIPTK